MNSLISFRTRPRWILPMLPVLLAGLACASTETQSPGTDALQSDPQQTSVPIESPLTLDTSPPSTANLARAVVQVLAISQDGTTPRILWSGSGSLINSNGLILTNAHVVDNTEGLYDRLGIALTELTDQPPELTYYGEIRAIDYPLDLAVVAIVSDLDGKPLAIEFPYVTIGDSDQLEIGDSLRIMGYPGIGGETITFTEGPVSGFTAERSVEGRAWIKTEATIAGGNSGGLAINDAGELIGVPTIVSSGSEDGQTVDCRPLADTNRDGQINELDSCVSVGGFINALRPINLARPLIEAAIAEQSYVSGISPAPVQGSDIDTSASLFLNLEFSDGVTSADLPERLWYALPSGSSELCLFWDYEGMSDGMVWGVHWFFDGEYLNDVSMPNQVWQGGPEGNWWTCITAENSLDDGLYEVSLEVEGEVLATESVFLGGNRELVDFKVENQTPEEICYIYFSPSLAQNWGADELAADETLDPGGERTLQVVSGQYDVLMDDCEGNQVYEGNGIEVGSIRSLEISE